MTDEDVLRRLPDAVVVFDAENRILGWLAAAQTMFGWSASEVVGMDVDDLLQPKDSNGNSCCIGVGAVLARMRGVKATREHEALVMNKDGKEIWTGVTTNLERDGEGRLFRTVAVLRDITRRKSVDLAKSEVISAVSHELRSPLTSVKGFTSTLLRKWDQFDEETKKHFLFTINSDADRVTRLIGELLDISRLEAGRLQLRKQPIQVPEIVSRVITRLEHLSEKHDLKAEFPRDFPDVFADQDKVEQVLTNLVENAIKYTEDGRVRVGGSSDESFVTVVVSDEGEGIPTDQRTQVFGKFFRRGERSGNPTGTGLGLYISKGLIEAHGGKIWVEEATGGGASFAFTLPRDSNGRSIDDRTP